VIIKEKSPVTAANRVKVMGRKGIEIERVCVKSLAQKGANTSKKKDVRI